MLWRNPLIEKPSVGDSVAVLLEHWKKDGRASWEIYFGAVGRDPEDVFVFNDDSFGQGCSVWRFPDVESKNDCNLIRAWAPAEEFPEPQF